MSSSTLRCPVCRESTLEHQAAGLIDIDVSHLARLRINPLGHEGVIVEMECKCGKRREWIVREHIQRFTEERTAHAVN